MADEYRTERVLGVPRATEFPPQHDLPQRRGYHAYAAMHEPAPDPADVASVLGLPPDAIGPQVLAALAPLLDELDRLRWQSGQNDRRRDYLERAADRHPLLPCLNRHAFVREVDALLQAGTVDGTLAVIHVGGIEPLRRAFGMVAGDGALRHACANILASLRASDLVGCLDDSDFGLLLAAADLVSAAAKLDEIRRRIVDPPFTWQGGPITLLTAIGTHPLGRGDSAEQALADADRHRRGLD